MLHSHISPCLYVGKIDRLIHSWKVHVHPFVRLWTHLACFLIRPSMNTSLHYQWSANISLFMHRLFICWWTYPSSRAPFVHPIRYRAMFVCVPISAVTHDEMTSNLKAPSLPWRMIISDAGDRESWQGCEAGWRLWALLNKTTQESLGDEYDKFGSMVTVREVWLSWRTKLHSFWEEQSRLQKG